MVRINLLPEKRQVKARSGFGDTGQMWILMVAGGVILEILVVLFVHKLRQDTLASIVGENTRYQVQIETIKKEIANHNEIKQELKELREREEAIQKLKSARTGPTTALLELSHILTQSRGPTTDRDKLEQLRRDNPAAVPNPNWDPKRLWLTEYKELERAVKITGLARDGEDVSELQRRLVLSDFFYEVKLLSGAKVIEEKTKQELRRFEINAKVRY